VRGRSPCMTEGEWSGWWDLNLLLHPRDRAADPCEDCTLIFAASQRAVCDGTPGDLTPAERLERRRARRRELRHDPEGADDA
jgi:hypothetical protein